MVTHKGIEDFTFRTQEDWAQEITTVIRNARLSGGVISGICLLVGGIGIMNIMLASISERVREIGIRKAIGAKRRDIMAQFLIEALMICLLGGLLGIIAGTGSAFFLKLNAGWAIVITANSIILSFSLSVAIGIFFGFYPAWKAANSHVIDALRYE